ncbi:hypothetical protein BJX96DRAFT_187286 [Aspergillus floccosus]
MEDRTLSETLSARHYYPDGRIVKRTVIPGQQQNQSTKGSEEDPKSHLQMMAQRAYRLKKEAIYRNMENHLSSLQDSMKKISNSLSVFHQMVIQSDLHITHPCLFGQLEHTVREVQDSISSTKTDSERSRESNVVANYSLMDADASFGYVVDQQQTDSDARINFGDSMIARTGSHSQPPPACQLCLPKSVARPPSSPDKGSLSFNESSFSRRLHRYCLTHIYQLFIDPRSNPQEVYRVFRLVPCIKYRQQMIPYLKCLVWAGPHENLEIPATPFYCIGGAGTHFPRFDSDGNPIYPENMRLPRKILGTLPEGWSGEAKGPAEERHELLKMHGLDGSWLDCHDVERYLEEMGFSFDQSNGSGTWKPTMLRDASVQQEISSSSSSQIVDKGNRNRTNTGPSSSRFRSSWVLDVDELLRGLLKNMIILGRAPGFRKVDVEEAFRSSITILSE